MGLGSYFHRRFPFSRVIRSLTARSACTWMRGQVDTALEINRILSSFNHLPRLAMMNVVVGPLSEGSLVVSVFVAIVETIGGISRRRISV